jgi:RNA polymerase sigma-70 factor (ECF subfamily)
MGSPQHLDLATARRILKGDAREFKMLFDAYFPRLYRFALVRLNGDADAAGDVVQQTFCRAIERLDSYRGEAALYTWFCQICRNAIVDYCRSRNREWRAVRTIDDDMQLRAIIESIAAPLELEPENEAVRVDVSRLVQATVDALPSHYGDVLEWKYIDGLSVSEIAQRLTIGPKAAESLLTRAREAFRQTILELVDVPDALQLPHG